MKGSGILAVGCVVAGALGVGLVTSGSTPRTATPSAAVQDTVVRLLAVGDVNLGRRLGKILLAGDTLHPWRAVADTFARYDIVFANLESNLSEQHGRTESPASNTIFTGPPVGAASLRRAGITLVATANNHALDFGADALRQTHALLDSAGVLHAGSSFGPAGPWEPARFTVQGMRVALVACTDLMNGRPGNWRRWVADADTARLLPAIRAARASSDVVLVSIHGGEEYAASPTPRMLALCRAAVDAGALVVLGHHPHVPYRPERYHGGIIAPSLGNFVFKQPFQYWTQRAYGLAVEFARDSTGVVIRTARSVPVRADYQPAFLERGPEYDAVEQRTSMESGTRGHE